MRQLIMLPLSLAACGGPEADRGSRNQRQAETHESSEQTTPCAKTGPGAYSERCIVERSEGPRGLVLTLRHPDGAFRRLLITKDGRGVVTADGAEPAKVRIVGADRIEVSVADERYELPATITSDSRR